MSESRHEPGTGAVLDIGGDIGALLIMTGAELDEAEIEICPVDRPEARTHNQVHTRRVGDRVSHAALFPALAAGRYRILARPGAPPAQDDTVIAVTGGQVTLLRLTDPE
jgi:hypothetical protein